MFTARPPGAGGRLAASLTNTNCIQSMISTARDTTSNVKRWRDGKMIKRWCAVRILNAECSFRRLEGRRQKPLLAAAFAVTSKLPHPHAILHEPHDMNPDRHRTSSTFGKPSLAAARRACRWNKKRTRHEG